MNNDCEPNEAADDHDADSDGNQSAGAISDVETATQEVSKIQERDMFV